VEGTIWNSEAETKKVRWEGYHGRLLLFMHEEGEVSLVPFRRVASARVPTPYLVTTVPGTCM